MKTQKWVKSAVLSATVASLLAGCTAAPAEGPVTISFWAWAAGSAEAAAAFNESQDRIIVEFEEIPGGGGGGYQKISSSASAGEGPDVAQVEYDTLPSFAVAGTVVDISKYLPGEAESKFSPFTWSQVNLDGGVYGVPLDLGPMGMMYRSDLLAELGIDAPKTWDEFEKAAAAVRAADPKKRLGNFDASTAQYFAALAWQAGAKWFEAKDDAWSVTVDSPETIAVAEYWQKLVKEGLVSSEQLFSPPLAQAQQKSTLLTDIGAVWETALLKANVPDQSGKWTAAPLPQWKAGEAASGNWGGTSWAVTKSSKNLAAAAEFAYWMTTSEESINIFIEKSGIYPASLEGQKLPALTASSDFYGGQPVFDVFSEAAKGVSLDWQWGPSMLSAYPIISTRLSEAFTKGSSVADALRKADEEIEADLEAQGIAVR
jgi:multiple sugar transport system substrate-binding protein